MKVEQEELAFEESGEILERPKRETRQARETEFMFYIRLPNVNREQRLTLNSKENLQYALHKLIDFDDYRYKSLSEDDMVFYLADEVGEPETDISPVDIHTPLIVVNCNRFVLTTRDAIQEEVPINNPDTRVAYEEPNSWFCWCFKRKRTEYHEDVYSSLPMP